jgi:peptidoglycan/xylan/chitin deacetylase (PgdA/CDA1 family)
VQVELAHNPPDLGEETDPTVMGFTGVGRVTTGGSIASTLMSDVTVLTFHAVGTPGSDGDPHLLFIPAARFARQMAFLAEHRQVVPLGQALEGSKTRGKHRVAITFDDGYRCLLDHAAPVLRDHGFPWSVFVPTGSIGDRNRWDVPTPDGLEIMSRDELDTARAHGASIESHGHAHLNLALAPVGDARADLSRSIEILTEINGTPPPYFAYPYGESTPAVEQLVADAGFEAAFTTGLRDGGTWAAARVPIRRDHPEWLFSALTFGYWEEIWYSRPGRVLGRSVGAVKRRLRARS